MEIVYDNVNGPFKWSVLHSRKIKKIYTEEKLFIQILGECRVK